MRILENYDEPRLANEGGTAETATEIDELAAAGNEAVAGLMDHQRFTATDRPVSLFYKIGKRLDLSSLSGQMSFSGRTRRLG